jgi:predicted DCC family thiol-disulfide oxidoreductase YuxK
MTLVFYDGVCGLCGRFVRFLLARDRQDRLRFAPLQGALARRELVPRGHDPADLNTVVVLAGWPSADARLLTRSRAVLHAAGELGAGWRALTAIARLVPRGLADALYAAVARRRYRLFGRVDACPLPRPEWRDRFLD